MIRRSPPLVPPRHCRRGEKSFAPTTATALLTLLFTGVLLTDAFPALRGPGPWPPEWRWLYLPLGGQQLERQVVQIGLLVAYVAVGALLMWRADWKPAAQLPKHRLSGSRDGSRGGSRDGSRPRQVLALAVLFLFVWQLVQTWVREQSLLDTLIFRVYAPPLNGYFIAPAQAESVSHVLHHYAESIPTFFGDRPQTHPPGLFLFYAVSNGVFARLPQLSAWFAPIARSWAIPGRDWVQLHDALITSAFVTAWLQVALTSLAPLSLYALLRRLARQQEWPLWVALALPLIPPLTLFLLQWDTTYPTIGFAAWALAVRGQERLGMGRRTGWGDWLAAGLLLSLLTWLSYGAAVFALFVGLHMLWRTWGRGGWPATLGGLAVMTAATALPWLLAYAIWNMNFFELLQIGLHNHYALVTSHRDYAVWVWMNLVDFALWLGPGPLLLGAAGSIWLLRARGEKSFALGMHDLAGIALIFWPALLLLDLSGSTRGEIGRLWIFLMPFPVILGLTPPWTFRQRLLILAAMALVSWAVGWAIAPFACC